MQNELSLIRFGFLNFNHLILTSQPLYPITTKLIKIVMTLVNAEPEKDKEMVDKVQWIYDNTHEKIMMPLSVIEYATYKNLGKTLNREIDIKNKTFNLIFLYRVLDEISLELNLIVTNIVKKYSIDIPIMTYGSQQQRTDIEI
jgi:hypothetical protein